MKTDALLEELRRRHESGNPASALYALELCARSRAALPSWLCEVVLRAIETYSQGKPDALLGLGNSTALTQQRRSHVQGRNWAIRDRTTRFAAERKRDGVSAKEHVRTLAEDYSTSIKNVEKILYRPHKKPTSTRRK